MHLRAGYLYTAKIALFFVLLLALIVQSRRFFLDARWGQFDLSRRHMTGLSDGSRSFLKKFPGKIAFTYFVTPASSMPAQLKGVVAPTKNLLASLQNASPNKISYRVIDPDQSPAEGSAYAARKKVSPNLMHAPFRKTSTASAMSGRPS